MTTLAAVPVMDDQLDLLNLITQKSSPLGKLHADDFRAACEAVEYEGIVDPNLVSAWLHARFGEVKPQWYSAMWAGACGPKGFLDKTETWVPIDGTYSRGNANKRVQLRRLRTRPDEPSP